MTPERAQGYLGAVMPLLREGGPVVALLLLCIGTAMVWFMVGALERSVVRNHALVERLQGCMKEQVELVLKLREHQP